jgi:hypothetical protein
MMLQQVGRLLQIRPLLASIAVTLLPDPHQVGLQWLFKLSSRQPAPLAKYEYGRVCYQNLSIVTFPTWCRKDSRVGLSCSALGLAPRVFEKCEDTDDIKNLISSMAMVKRN